MLGRGASWSAPSAEYRSRSRGSALAPSSAAPRRDHARGHAVGGEQLGAGAAVDPRIRRPPRAGASAARQASRSHGAQSAPSMPASATGWMPDRRPEAGTPQADASITASPKPSSCDGTTTALAALIQYGTSSGGTPPSVSSGTSPAASSRAVEALERPRRVVREQEVGPVGVEARAARAPRRAGSAGSASRSTPHGQHRDAPRRPGAGDVLAERARDRGGQRR